MSLKSSIRRAGFVTKKQEQSADRHSRLIRSEPRQADPASWGATFREIRVWLLALALAAFVLVLLVGQVSSAAVPSGGETVRASFALCHGSARQTCVVDGDTFWLAGTKIRVADIDAPEVSRPGCAHEAAIGAAATQRFMGLLNEGAFTLAAAPDARDVDRYGRALRVVERGGASLGEVLVAEGLAGRWGGARVAWC